MAFVCVDIGGTNTLLGVGNDEFDVVETMRTAAFLDDVVGNIYDAIENAGHDAQDINLVAAAVAGPMDRDRGVFYPPNIDRDVVQIMEPLGSIGADVRLINDCNAAALGEYRVGDHGTDDLVYLTISSGIGAGVIAGGRLLNGKDGNAAEVGHLVVDPDGLTCGCGGQGCWEAYCSGDNLPGLVATMTGQKFEDARAVFAAYQEDADLDAVFDRVRRYNARGIAAINDMYDPEMVVVGGGVGLNHADVVLDGIDETVEAETVNRPPEITLAALEERSIIHGLRALARG